MVRYTVNMWPFLRGLRPSGAVPPSPIAQQIQSDKASPGMANQFVDEKYSGPETTIDGVLVRPKKRANCTTVALLPTFIPFRLNYSRSHLLNASLAL